MGAEKRHQNAPAKRNKFSKPVPPIAGRVFVLRILCDLRVINLYMMWINRL